MATQREVKQGWPARLLIAGIVTGAMILTAVLLIGISWFGSQQSLRHVAGSKAHAAAVITAVRMQRIIAPAESILRSLAFDPIAADTSMPERLQRLAAIGAKLRANPLVAGVYIGYDNGDFLAVRLLDTQRMRDRFHAPADAVYLVQSIDRSQGADAAGKYFFYNADYRLIAKWTVDAFRIDPRVRPWYVRAKHKQRVVITKPYVFYSSGWVGISIARRAHDAQSVVGLDITLAGLSDSLSELPVPGQTKLALVNSQGEVIGSSTGFSIRPGKRGSVPPDLPRLPDLNSSSLSRLWASDAGQHVIAYRADGEKWLGTILPFHGLQQLDLKLLVAIPASGLLGNLTHNRLLMIGAAIVLLVLFLPLGWWGGRKTGMAMETMVQQAHRLSRFDFSKNQSPPTVLQEANALSGVLGDVSDTMEAFLSISHVLGAEPELDTMLDKVLERLVSAARCDGGAVYLYSEADETLSATAAVGYYNAIEAWAADDFASRSSGIEDSTCNKFELRGRRGQLVGLLILQHDADQNHRSPEFLAFASRLTGMLAVAIETRHLTEAQEHLFDAMVRVLADAIDAKSPYTGGHCTRVPQLALMLADQMEADNTGPFAEFSLQDDERRSFQLAAWLHDAGKITSPESVVDKATKLETIHNRIHEIRMRFELLWRDAEVACLQAQRNGASRETAEAERDATHARLQADFEFVAQCNIGGERMDEADVDRLRKLADLTWLRHFDDRLGLSRAETSRISTRGSEFAELPVTEHLLADKKEHLIPWGASHKPAVEPDDPKNTFGFDMRLPEFRQNLGELYNLSICTGTLSPEDRYLINDHVVQTLVMLKKLPWPEHLAQVPELAATHHERMDGQGYPRGLAADSLSTLDRILALADVFEALTAPDRPYKPAKTVSTSLRIMAMMCNEGHLDTQLYLYFLQVRIWQTYAHHFVAPAQIDDVDIDALAALALETT